MAKQEKETANAAADSLNKKIRLWAIIGDSDSGKSTSIGYLVSHLGRGRPSYRYIYLRGGGYLLMYVRKQSLQEAKRTPEKVVVDTIAEARKLATREKVNLAWFNVLYAIRSDTVNGLPTADAYLSHFVDCGWKIESLILMNYKSNPHARYYNFGAPTYELHDAAKLVRDPSTHTHMVGQIRNHFGWA